MDHNFYKDRKIKDCSETFKFNNVIITTSKCSHNEFRISQIVDNKLLSNCQIAQKTV